MESVKIHKTADVSKIAKIGKGSVVWNNAQIRENAIIGKNCIISRNVYIDEGVIIGDNVKIQNNVSVYKGVTIENGVFIGPDVVFTNDKYPRAVNKDRSLKKKEDWILEKTRIKQGASIGANSTILPGITIGRFSMIGAGSVVTKDVADFILVYGNPAKVISKINIELKRKK
ncbi:MAG: acetyltransferase [Actinobacteria bacterium]|nr:acetyltransferase [Actinomycetota bacterium]